MNMRRNRAALTGRLCNPEDERSHSLVREYVAVHTIRLAAVPPVDHKRLLKEPLLHIPAGAKLLRSEANKGQFTCVFGIFHSCQQFVQASRSFGTPI